MFLRKKNTSKQYINKALRNKYGFPSQIIPINNELGVMIGTFIRTRSYNYAQYGVWLIALDFEYHSEGLAAFGTTQRDIAQHDFQRLFMSVNNAIAVLNTGNDEAIKNNYIARFLNKEMAIYKKGQQL